MSREYKNRRIVIWPSYIDSSLSRKNGRRVSKMDGVSNPTIEEIVEAARQLDLNPVIENSPYPRLWWRVKQRVIVDKKYNKQEILRRIASKIKDLRKSK
ncbi:MAG: signal recognition particle protein Srp19 [Desulfurococcales archaeon]|nr:signal recognition particle protein Srp19 [Desulfurococcales archaeon]